MWAAPNALKLWDDRNNEDAASIALMTYRLYLDVCCLNRPFDDWTQSRVRIEAETILAILDMCQAGQWQLVSSTALRSEIERTADPERRQRVLDALAMVTQRISVTETMVQRAAELQPFGFKAFDALHVACAEAAAVDGFLTTDDRLIRYATRTPLSVLVSNPVTWFMTVTATDNVDSANGGTFHDSR